MRVKTVKIENFKRFETLEVDLGALDCLVGANNSGKTTLLQALALFDFCVHHCLERKNGQFKLRPRTIAPEDFYVLPVSNAMDIWHERRTMAGGKQRRVKVSVLLDTGNEVTATLKLDFNRFGVSVAASNRSQEGLTELAELRIAYLPVFSMFLPREERRIGVAIEDELVRGRVHSIIRNLILELKKEERDEELTAILRRSFPALKDMRIEFDEVTDRYISVTYKEEGRPKEFDIFSAGSGFQQFLYLFGFILLRKPTVVMLDEPDVHLHGSLQAVLLEELKRLVEQGNQVLFATHSRELITRVGPENILSLDGGATRLQVAFDVFDTLDRLGSLDPTQLALIQAYRRVVVVEDRTDCDLLCIFCAKSLGIEKWQQVESRIAFCFSRGNPWKQHDMSRLRRVLQQVISVEGQALELFVIADRDYYPDLDDLRQTVPSDHMCWHIWQRVEIENYLLHFPAIRRLVSSGERQLTLDEGVLQQEFDRLIESSRNSASDHLVQAFEEMRKKTKENWDAATMSRKAREYLEEHWDKDKITLADAKDVVLPGIKRWLQENDVGQFSDKKLAESLEPNDLPEEVHQLAQRLAEFVGLPVK
ncbi:MAG: AAA family ATPase [Planctomycetes bacterium]|nr:AAA family ATPase [Planctomycetota bacterium]